jgi:hypothetical protein
MEILKDRRERVLDEIIIADLFSFVIRFVLKKKRTSIIFGFCDCTQVKKDYFLGAED